MEHVLKVQMVMSALINASLDVPRRRLARGRSTLHSTVEFHVLRAHAVFHALAGAHGLRRRLWFER